MCVLCFVAIIVRMILPISGLPHTHWNNHANTSMPVRQPRRILVNQSHDLHVHRTDHMITRTENTPNQWTHVMEYTVVDQCHGKLTFGPSVRLSPNQVSMGDFSLQNNLSVSFHTRTMMRLPDLLRYQYHLHTLANYVSFIWYLHTGARA